MINEILKLLITPSEKIKYEAAEILTNQGHVATGKLRDSISYKISFDQSVISIDFYIEDYGQIVNNGVAPNRVPFGGGNGKKSKYIEALIRWSKIIKPSLSDKKRIGFAIAVAKTHKKEGISSFGSRAFSKTGRRKGWLIESVKASTSILDVTEFENKYIGEILDQLRNK